ncbi:hypothetical protein AYK86_16360 [Acinetobacter venetianus]|uniref:acyltransferase family protein n=1 Tax=Acinetobacter venetianus TaxID=52133 RepID=UPI000775EA61|nr:acyltransferase [Acinetobacter venetianus]KXO85690.1 hypothetical protein AYK86_16360 [Acinetobacter venetianus]
MVHQINNFDLIRFLAACQVVYTHGIHHLRIEGPIFSIFEKFIQYFPGVPIFFTVSGFLIFWSFDRKPKLKQYIKNRILRLYPALYVCLAVTILLLILSSSYELLNQLSFYVWLITQATFFQFYTPDILRFWGVGTPNGSLWTIAVEVQFYVIVPIIYFLIKKFNGAIILTTLFLISVILNFALTTLEPSIIKQLIFISIAPYLFNFIIGSTIYLYWNKLKFLFEGKFLFWFIAYLIYFNLFGNYLGYEIKNYQINNIFQLITPILLSLTTISFAFSFNNLSNKILNHNDISYGVYIYHMLVINTLVYLGYTNDNLYFFAVFFITLLLGYLSWILIEKNALKLKNKF